MAYRDPYHPPQVPQSYEQAYRDNDDYDPYYNTSSQTQYNPPYDQAAYRDADNDDYYTQRPPKFIEPKDEGGMSPQTTVVGHTDAERKERPTTRYEAAGFPPVLRPPK